MKGVVSLSGFEIFCVLMGGLGAINPKKRKGKKESSKGENMKLNRENYGLPYWQWVITDKKKIKQSWLKRLIGKIKGLKKTRK